MSLKRLGLETSANIPEWNHQSSIVDGMFRATLEIEESIGANLAQYDKSFQSLVRPIVLDGVADYMAILLDAKEELSQIETDIKRGLEL